MTLPALASLPVLDDVCRVAERMRALAGGDRLDRCGQIAVEHLGTLGKALRAQLAADAARCLGASDAQALGWATCCELLHEASLVHDDLQDRDTTRRGAPALWVRHGAGQAINVGDLLILLATAAVSEIPVGDDIRWKLAEALSRHATRAVRGQSIDLALEPAAGIRWSDWERSADKTAALFELPVHGAVLLAGGTPREASEAAAPFGAIGAIYQLADDVADLFGGEGRAGSDVRSRRVTALVAQHLELYPGDAGWMLQTFGGPVDDRVIAAVRDRFRDSGTLEELIDRACLLARGVLDGVSGPLRPLALSLLDRTLAPLRALDASLPAAGAA